MFSSKSTTLISEIEKYKTKEILVINSKVDKRSNNCIKTHDNKKYPCIMLNELSEIFKSHFYKEQYINSNVILIDEAQFFNDLYNFIHNQLSDIYNDKIFIVAGLQSDYNMKPIGDIIKLIPLADEIQKLSANCIFCNRKANFNKLKKNVNIFNNDDLFESFNSMNTNFLVGGENMYEPCCRMHFLS